MSERTNISDQTVRINLSKSNFISNTNYFNCHIIFDNSKSARITDVDGYYITEISNCNFTNCSFEIPSPKRGIYINFYSTTFNPKIGSDFKILTDTDIECQLTHISLLDGPIPVAYPAILYTGKNGKLRFIFGCENHTVNYWIEHMMRICKKHVGKDRMYNQAKLVSAVMDYLIAMRNIK